MGLFGKIFDKKTCDICGNDIGLLGNKKLDDGNMCKECAKKLSPWFDDRRHTSVENIKAQLDYREANKAEVEKFHTTRSFGQSTLLHIDEDAGKFLVATTNKWDTENPDVIELSCVTGADLDVSESSHEEMRTIKDKDGNSKRVSHVPPQFVYSYDFYMVIHVNHPYFDKIRFKLNRSSMNVNITGKQSMGFSPGRNYADYQEYERIGREIKEALMNARQQIRDEAAAAAAPKTATTCPWCGATTMPNANGCCEYCGGALNG